MTASVSSQLQRISSNNKINDSTNIGIIIHRLWNYKPSNGYTIGNERILFGIIELFIFTLGVPGSMIVLSYFILKSKEKTASTLLYALISTLDLTICVLCLTMAITDLTGEAVMFGSTFYCHVWGYLWDVNLPDSRTKHCKNDISNVPVLQCETFPCRYPHHHLLCNSAG